MNEIEQAREALDRIEAAIHELAGEVAPGGPEDRAWAAVNDARAALSRPVEGVKGEPDFARSIADVAEEERAAGATFGWRSCSGCHETNEGYETGHYPYSPMFGCFVGSGCSECGGIGVVWEYWDAAALEAMLNDDAAPPVADSEALRERVAELEQDRDQALEKLDARIAMHHSTEEELDKTKAECEAWAANYADLQSKLSDLRVVANYNREQAETAEARLAQAEREPAVTERQWDEIPNAQTDDAHPINVLAGVLHRAEGWEPETRIIGNVRAGDIVRAIRAFEPAALEAALHPQSAAGEEGKP